MKKLLCLVFSLMVAVMAAGCGGSDKQAAAPQAGKTLRLAAAASMEKVSYLFGYDKQYFLKSCIRSSRWCRYGK